MPPLKRRKELQALSEDHHNALVIALRCRRIASGETDIEPEGFWDGADDFFRLEAIPHFDVEEELLLPALEALGEHEMAERIRLDHQQLRKLVGARPVDRERLGELGRLLDDHVRFEEREVFESTQDRIPAETLAEIERASTAIPQICPTTFRKLPRARRD